jgi:hypothetical protein
MEFEGDQWMRDVYGRRIRPIEAGAMDIGGCGMGGKGSMVDSGGFEMGGKGIGGMGGMGGTGGKGKGIGAEGMEFAQWVDPGYDQGYEAMLLNMCFIK